MHLHPRHQHPHVHHRLELHGLLFRRRSEHRHIHGVLSNPDIVKNFVRFFGPGHRGRININKTSEKWPRIIARPRSRRR